MTALQAQFEKIVEGLSEKQLLTFMNFFSLDPGDTPEVAEKKIADKVQPYTVAIAAEYLKARMKFGPMRGPHEGYAVLLEEVDEFWDAIKANNLELGRKEAFQVGAMALAFLGDVQPVREE